MTHNLYRICLVSLLLGLLMSGGIRANADQVATLQRLTGVLRGVAVVLEDPELASQLAVQGKFVVHLLTADSDHVDPWRRQIAKANLGGRVVVGILAEDRRLPYPDRLVNLLVMKESQDVPLEEVKRVLAVRDGRALLASA